MWPSSTSYQSDVDEGIDGSQASSNSIASSIGIIGRKNLRADAPVFKASNSDVSYATSYEPSTGELAATSDPENFYAQEVLSDYPQISRSSMEQCRISPETMSSKDHFPSPSQLMFFSHEDRADFNSGCSTGYAPNNRYLTQAPSPRNTGRMMMLQTPLPSPLTITQPPYNYSSPQHHQQSRGMSMQSMQDMTHSHMASSQGETPPRSPSHSMMGSGVSVFSPIAMNVYRDKQPQQQPQPQQSMSLSPMNNFSREQQRLAQPLISADGYVYQVHFKRAHRNFLLSPSAPRNILPGDFVKVEADRGEDLGVVVSKSLVEDFVEFVPTAGYRGRGYSAGLGEKKYIIRFATAEERMLLRNKVEDEERTLQVIREKVIERRLPMAILDAEYQFDHHKLVYFFEADRRIDFRELVSDLFSLYKTRIWMQQVDTSTIPGEEVGLRLAHAAGFLPSSYMTDGADALRDIDELTQTVSEFAAVQVFQADEDINLLNLTQDSYRESYPLSSAASPSHARGDRLRSVNSGERELDLLIGDTAEPHKSTSKAPFLPLSMGYGSSFGASTASGSNVVDDEEHPSRDRDLRGDLRGEMQGGQRGGKGDFGGSMGPLLNGAWAYEH